jgi:hypothetical protein
MKQGNSQLRQQLRQLEDSRAVHLKTILDMRGALRRGSLVTVNRKCGKDTCHCATGQGHPAKYLSVKQDGKTSMIYVPSSSELRVADEALRYRRYRQARAALAKLARQSLEIIDALEHALLTAEPIASTRARRRTKKKPPSPKGS